MSFSIDIVIPVYNAPDDTRRCVESVLEHPHDGCRITLIDDGSTDPGVAALFDELADRRRPELLLLRNDRNVGFTATANRGIANSRADVVLLNSDTRVTGDWLSALRACAESDSRIGTITPFSNNAEICSFPRFCVDNPIGSDDEAEAVGAAIAEAAVPTYPELPTGVGFCLFVRRALIDELGAFDEAFGAGYGEENDLCLRAVRAGWRNVLADNAFVVHVGARSFGGRKSDLSPRNTTILLERHPHYTTMVASYIAADPLAPLREAAAMRLTLRTTHTPGVLHVIHDHGGGTEMHVRALIDASRERWRHYLAIAVGDTWQIEEHRFDGRVVTLNVDRLASQSWRDFVGAICATFGITVVHLHNISGCRDGLSREIPDLGIPYGYTVHDLNFACPTITFLGPDQIYCGAQTDSSVCTACLRRQSDFTHVDIDSWRSSHHALLRRASFVIAPSQWAARMLKRYFADVETTLIGHGFDNGASVALETAPELSVPDDGIATIAVLGAVGPDKGARRIERLVDLARQRNAPVRFVLIGYLDVQHTPWQSDDARFTIHGRYAHEELAALLAHYRTRLVLYPSAGPETFSYTLSETRAAGVPVLVPPIGALAERVESSGGGWVMTEGEWRDESRMLARVIALVDVGNRSALEAAGDRAKSLPHSTLAEMSDATFALYERCAARGPLPSFAPLSPIRIRDALGYRRWTPPSAPQPEAAQPGASSNGVGTRVAQAALAIRHTAIGRTLYRMTPRPVLDALKARLKT